MEFDISVKKEFLYLYIDAKLNITDTADVPGLRHLILISEIRRIVLSRQNIYRYMLHKYVQVSYLSYDENKNVQNTLTDIVLYKLKLS